MEAEDEGALMLVALFRILSKPGAMEILALAGRGIDRSADAMMGLDLSPRQYYTRLKALVGAGLVEGGEGEYAQTPLGRIIISHLLPLVESAIKHKDDLRLLEMLRGTKMEAGVRRVFSKELGPLDILGLQTVRSIENYESMVCDVIDMYDEADESVLLATNYIDVRVMEACFRSTERGVANKLIIGKKGMSSKLRLLRMMLSPVFTKAIINFATNRVNLEEFQRVADLPYTFCVVDGRRNLIIISETVKEKFIVAFLIEDGDISEKLTAFFERLWEGGEFPPAIKFVNSLKST